MKIRRRGANSVMQALSEVLQRNLLGHANTMWVEEPERVVEVVEVEDEAEKEADTNKEQDRGKEKEKEIDEQEAFSLILEGLFIEPREE
jgi:hypothetical protein